MDLNKEIACLEIDKSDLTKARIHQQGLEELSDGEVLLQVEKISLTANNITYCLTGDVVGYWKFFEAEDGWGRMPGMGIAKVLQSNHPEIEEGERLWGFLPFASHLKIQPTIVNDFNFKDDLGERNSVAPVYANFDRVGKDKPADSEQEDLMMLLRGLYVTGWLIEDFVSDNANFGASQYVITSASSKTSMSLASQVKKRGEMKSVGLTSKSNIVFVESLELYDEVVAYDAIETLDSGLASVVVDMAGNPKVIADVHNHFKDNIKHSSQVGVTHQGNAFSPEQVAALQDIPGAKPTFFFAPSQIAKRNNDWGKGEVEKRVAEDLIQFCQFSKNLINLVHMNGPEKFEPAYQKMLAGDAKPSEAYILSMWS